MAEIFTTTAGRYTTPGDHLDWGDETRDWVIDQARTGDPKAVAALYDRHHDVVRGFAAHLLGEESAAEDLVHEVFVTLPKAIRRFRGDSTLRSFLLGITANHARHHVRAAARRRAAYDRMERGRSSNASSTPETLCQQRELAKILERALDSLSLKHRVVFVLCDIEERTSAEASEIIGIPPATVRTRLFHARRKLREVLEKEVIR